MKTRRLLKLQTLKDLGACASQVAKFRKLWGKQVFVTVPRMVAVADQFDWDWGAAHLLSAAALAEYRRARAPALAEYRRARAPAWAEYERARAPAWAEYERARAPARAEYERVTAAAWAEYERVAARAFAEAYIND